MRTKRLAAGLAAAAALSVPFVFAAPAMAATLPTGDALYAITCDEDGDSGIDFALLYSVSPVDAVGTLIGDGSDIFDDCAGEAAFNPVTGNSYYISWSSEGSSLVKIDVATGATTSIPWTGDYEGNYPDSIAIGTDGIAYVISGPNLARVDLTTGAWDELGSLGFGGLYGFSVDPTSGLFYAIDQGGYAYRIDPAAVTATAVGRVLGGSSLSYSLQIDTSGAWWVQWDHPGDPYTVDIWTGARPVDGGDSQLALVGPLNDIVNEYYPYSQALLITYPKALAATGMDATALVVVGGSAAAFLLLAGAVLLRRRRTA
jgi:LPXTG-motif cell wall-anchored protein